MRKRLLSALLALCMALVLLPGPARAAGDLPRNHNFDREDRLRFAGQGSYNSAYYINAAALPRNGSGTGYDADKIKFDGVNDYDSAYEVFDSLNSYRRENGLSPLVMDEDLLAAAMQRAAEIAVYYSHTRPDGSDCFSAFPSKFVYGTKRENIAIWYTSADAVMTGWKNSPGHNANMLADNNSSAGIGAFVDGNGGRYWVQLFTSNQGTAETVRSSGKRAVTANVAASAGVLNISVSPSSAALQAGETVTFTARNTNREWSYSTPAVYLTYAQSQAPNVATVSVGSDGKAVVTAVGGGQTTLKLGVSAAGSSAPITVDVPITVTAAPAVTFTDVPQWCAPAANWAAAGGVANGTGNNRFDPGSPCTHVHILTFLYRANRGTGAAVVEDMAKAITWAREKGMIGSSFAPDAPCTRASAVKYIWQAFGSQDAAGSSFTDVPAGADYAAAVSWALANGVTNGYGDTFRPNQTCSRAEIVTFLHRAYVPEVRLK